MADTLRSIAVLVAATLSFCIESISPSVADATASIVVSVIIAVSLAPLIVGLLKTISELKVLKSIDNTPVPWMEEYQHLPSLSPRIMKRRR
jgi:Co/Zn/Cd efflux system component